MAGDGGSPSDLLEEKFYISDNRRKVTTVICLICENAYYESHFSRLKGTIRLSKVLGICPDHPDLDLTSNEVDETLSIPARRLIAQVKYSEKEKAQEEILNSVSLNVGKHNIERNNLTIVGDGVDDYTILKSEIALLRQLNSELQEKNKILKELLEVKKEKIEELQKNRVSGIVTYAQTAKNKEDKINHIPNVIVIPKTNRDKPKTSRAVKNSLLTDIIVPIKRVQDQQDGSVKIKCASKDDVVKLNEQLADKLGREFIIKQEEIQNPRLKITGIENDMTIEELEADINERNFSDTDLFCNVEHIYKNSKTSKLNAIITLPQDAYNFIRANNYKFYIGHQCLKSYDDLNIMPCFNCGRVGHSGKKCRNSATCLRCAGNHQTKDCDGKLQVKCANCCYGKEKYKDDRDVHHIATDTEKCTYLKIMIKRKINNTDYPIKPQVQKFFGYNGNLQEQTKITKETTKPPKSRGSKSERATSRPTEVNNE